MPRKKKLHSSRLLTLQHCSQNVVIYIQKNLKKIKETISSKLVSYFYYFLIENYPFLIPASCTLSFRGLPKPHPGVMGQSRVNTHTCMYTHTYIYTLYELHFLLHSDANYCATMSQEIDTFCLNIYTNRLYIYCT